MLGLEERLTLIDGLPYPGCRAVGRQRHAGLVLGLDSLAVAAAIGAATTLTMRAWRRMTVVFEAEMPSAGLVLGAPLARVVDATFSSNEPEATRSGYTDRTHSDAELVISSKDSESPSHINRPGSSRRRTPSSRLVTRPGRLA